MTTQPSADTDFRTASPSALAASLRACRADTLATLDRFEAALPDLQVPHVGTLNPPLWELGHIGWFQQHWLARNPQRHLGHRADPLATRLPARAPDSDVLFDSSRVAHGSRWQLPLPSVAALRESLELGLQRTLQLLLLLQDGSDNAMDADDALYFYRLVLAHEDMHHEAALYMAQAMGLPGATARWQPQAMTTGRGVLSFDAGRFEQGWQGHGFALDNELGAFTASLPAGHIDSRVLCWDDYLPFVEAGGYEQACWWSPAGRVWLQATGLLAPRYLRGTPWQVHSGGQWQVLDRALPACHLSAFEAEAWCAWAGRRLPSEGEWERAAVQAGPAFAWGAVWEWTDSPFEPYPGFVAHPYMDYSAPWFGSRRVLRGASFATQPRLRHGRYRNFYTPDRNDIHAGFRSCAM